MERSIVLVSALKKPHHLMPAGEDLIMPGDYLGNSSGVRFSVRDFFLDEADRSVLSMKMMLNERTRKTVRFEMSPEGANSTDERNTENKYSAERNNLEDVNGISPILALESEASNY